MIAQIQGMVSWKSPTRVVMDVGGIGFEIHIPVSTYEKLPECGKEAVLLTHLYVREDVLQLYGFWEERDRQLFQMLISISGVGPRMALGILSGVTVEEFTRAVANNNVSLLTRVPGVGKKTAQRLVMELRDKLGPAVEVGVAGEIMAGDILEEATLALVSLGYRQSEAKKAVEKVARSETTLPSVEVLIKKALQTAIARS